ncbi:MAG: hypothetical protein EBZ25_08160, partial [Flavobacteriia bacterium]|nr:hypothetical protein [Flavobacteriia bacterium]
MRKFVIYYRVSTKKQGDSGLGLAAQERDVGLYLDNYAEEPWEIVGKFTDIESGANGDRPELWKAIDLAEKLKDWEGGRLVVNIVEMPIKCPVAPLEFTFLADSFFKEKGMRDKVEMTYVTPLPGAFTKPIAAEAFGNTLDEKGIAVEPDFMLMEVDNEKKALVSYDEREIPFDLLVTVPLNMGADFIA